MSARTQPKMGIERVQVEHKVDEYPDLSYLGQYTAEWSEGCIDRQKRGDQGRNEYRYWKPGPNHYPHNPKSWSHVSAEQLDEAFKKLPAAWKRRRGTIPAILDAYYVQQDYERMEAYERQDWQYIGIIAKATVVGPGGVSQVLRSAGLWGVESDAGHEYHESVEQEELVALKEILRGFGFDEESIEEAFKQVESPV